MASLMAQSVAEKVSKMVRTGQKITIGKIVKSAGYSDSVSKSPTKVTRTKTFRNIMRNVTGAMEKERARILETMMRKDISAEKYGTLVQSADIITKNIQLLSGKATENVAMVIEVSEAIANKNKAKENIKPE